MALNIEALKESSLIELEPRILPVKRFINFVKESLMNGTDTISRDILADWMFTIPVMYGELRAMEAEFLLAVDLYDSEIEKVKADAQASKSVDMKVTEARAQAALLANDFQVRQYVSKFMARTINAYWSELEMLIFSVRALFESRNQIVNNDI